MENCPNCGNKVSEGAVFCDQCGTRLVVAEPAATESAPAPAGGSVICGACGAGNVPGEAFCDYCGSPLDAPVPTAEEVPELEPVSSEGELEVVPEAPVEEVESVEEPAAAEPAVAEAEAVEAVAAGPVVVEAEPAAPVAEQVEAAQTCPACGAAVQPDEAFCGDCGASLAQAPLPPEPVAEAELSVEAPAPEPVAEPVPAPVVEPAPPPPPPEPALTACPACGAEIEPGDAFCSSCGAVLKEPAPVVETAPPPAPAPAPAVPHLVVVTSGAEIPLPGDAEILIGREDPVSGVYPAVDLTPHGGEEGGVSRRHARLVVDGGRYFVEDLDSTNYTFVNKQKIAPKTRQAVGDGDEIRCGRVAMVLRTG